MCVKFLNGLATGLYSILFKYSMLWVVLQEGLMLRYLEQ